MLRAAPSFDKLLQASISFYRLRPGSARLSRLGRTGRPIGCNIGLVFRLSGSEPAAAPPSTGEKKKKKKRRKAKKADGEGAAKEEL